MASPILFVPRSIARLRILILSTGIFAVVEGSSRECDEIPASKRADRKNVLFQAAEQILVQPMFAMTRQDQDSTVAGAVKTAVRLRKPQQMQLEMMIQSIDAPVPLAHQVRMVAGFVQDRANGLHAWKGIQCQRPANKMPYTRYTTALGEKPHIMPHGDWVLYPPDPADADDQ
jgi:hypothetical protein